jgi:hypothetical protein
MIQTKLWCRTQCSHTIRKDKIINYVFAHCNHTIRKDEIINYVFAHCNDDKEIFPLTVKEIAKAQKKDKIIQKNKLNYENKLVKNLHVLSRMVV